MNIQDRIESYNKSFTHGLLELNDRIYGVWVMGNNYSNGDNRLYGAYPNSLLKRIKSLFPDKQNILHLFSGNVHDDITFDINPDVKPTILDDIRNVKNHKEIFSNINLIIADSPYEDKDFERYKQKPFNKTQVLRDLAEITKSDTILTWLDTIKPIYNSEYWYLYGEILVSVSTNHRYRGLCIFQRTDKVLYS